MRFDIRVCLAVIVGVGLIHATAVSAQDEPPATSKTTRSPIEKETPSFNDPFGAPAIKKDVSNPFAEDSDGANPFAPSSHSKAPFGPTKSNSSESKPVLLARKADPDVRTAKTMELLGNEMDVFLIDVTTTEAFEWLADDLGIQIVSDRAALAAQDIKLSEGLLEELRLDNVSGQMALEFVLRQAMTTANAPRPLPSTGELTWHVREGVVVITTRGALAAKPKTKVYALGKSFSTDERQQLSELLKKTCSPDSWLEQGGVGSITTFRDSLVISQAADVHREIKAVMAQLTTIPKKQVDRVR